MDYQNWNTLPPLVSYAMLLSYLCDRECVALIPSHHPSQVHRDKSHP
jgi:hypothetical protein